MSIVKTIGEYLDVIHRGIKNSDKIIESIKTAAEIKNYNEGRPTTITAEAIAEIMRRADICKECPFNSKNAIASGTYVTGLGFQHCILCKCRIGVEEDGSIQGKEACLSCNCGVEQFNAMHPESKMEVRWTAFNQ